MQMANKILAYTALTVCIANPSSAFAQGSFPDVPSDHPSYAAIEALASENILEGNPDGTFRPDATINRAEFVKIVGGAVELEADTERSRASLCNEDPTYYSSYSDVRNSDWFAYFVCLASSHSLASGYPDGTFRPSAPISFVEAAKVVARATGIDDGNIPETGPWYAPYVQYLSVRNAIPPSIQRFDQLITRGEMAEMYWRLRSRTTDLPSQTYERIAGLPERSYGLIELANAGDYGDKAIILQSRGEPQEVLVESIAELVSDQEVVKRDYTYKIYARLSPSVVFILSYMELGKGSLYKYDAFTHQLTSMRINERFRVGIGESSPFGTMLAWTQLLYDEGRVASDLYILDLASDTATLVITLPQDESLAEIDNLGPSIPRTDISWVSPTTIRYPVYSCQGYGYERGCTELKEYRTVSIGE